MVCWITSLPVLVGIPDGSSTICRTSHLGTTSTLYCHIFGSNCVDDILCSWRKFINTAVDFADPCLAAQYDIDTHIISCSTCCIGVVSRQLFSHGKPRVEVRIECWNGSCRSLAQRMKYKTHDFSPDRRLSFWCAGYLVLLVLVQSIA